jgi:hypothetical protein
MQELLQKLKINEKFTKPIRGIKFDKVRANTYPKSEYNFMADLLHLPQTKYRYKYLFVITDLWSGAFDIEPIRNKTPEDALKALKKILTRPYISYIKASIRTDSGSEFKGIFHKWLYDENILHRVAIPNRHQQLANVENLNKLLGRLLNGYMNNVEEQTGKPFKQWTDAIHIIRKDLNEIRLKKDGDPQKDIMTPPIELKPKFKVGDLVYYKTERPMNAIGEFQPTNNFREGDYRFNITDPKTIKAVLYYPKNIRYILNGRTNASYTDKELILKR